MLEEKDLGKSIVFNIAYRKWYSESGELLNIATLMFVMGCRENKIVEDTQGWWESDETKTMSLQKMKMSRSRRKIRSRRDRGRPENLIRKLHVGVHGNNDMLIGIIWWCQMSGPGRIWIFC